MIICTFVNKFRNLKILSSKTHVMNFELRGHIIRKAELKKKEGKRPFKEAKSAKSCPTVDRLQFKGCEDGRSHRGSSWAGPQHVVDRL